MVIIGGNRGVHSISVAAVDAGGSNAGATSGAISGSAWALGGGILIPTA